jgi:RNA polymerase sigma-70 factor (ECF subfamily)
MAHRLGDGSTTLDGVALAPDADAFAARYARHRRGLHVHCYRMLGSFDRADEVVRAVSLTPPPRRERFDEAWFRAWLFRIATGACVDVIRAGSAGAPELQPYPDRVLDEIGAHESDQLAVTRGTIELVYIAALGLLPPRQRAALALRDGLGWSLSEIARLLDTSVAAANSALQRARAAVQGELGPTRPHRHVTAPTADEQPVLEAFVEARTRVDAAGTWRIAATAANRQPAAAAYLRPTGASTFRPDHLDVLRVDGGAIVEIATFDPGSFAAFGLPAAP